MRVQEVTRRHTRGGTIIPINSQSPYRVPLDAPHLAKAGLSVGDQAGIRYKIEDRPVFEIIPTDSESETPYRITRKITAGGSSAEGEIRLPHKVVEAGQLAGEDGELLYDDGNGVLKFKINQPPEFEEVKIATSEKIHLSKRTSGQPIINLSQTVAGPVDTQTPVYLSLTHHAGFMYFFLHPGKETAPDGAIELTPNPNTDRERTPGLSFYLPRSIEKAIATDGTAQKWARIENSAQLFGAYL